jgi:hypothetical protein
MWKNVMIGTALGLFLVSCATMPTGKTQTPQEVVVKVEATNPTNVKINQENSEERINKSMEVPNQEGDPTLE